MLGRFAGFPSTRKKIKEQASYNLLYFYLLLCYACQQVMYHPFSLVGENRIIFTLCHAAEPEDASASLFQQAAMDGC